MYFSLDSEEKKETRKDLREQLLEKRDERKKRIDEEKGKVETKNEESDETRRRETNKAKEDLRYFLLLLAGIKLKKNSSFIHARKYYYLLAICISAKGLGRIYVYFYRIFFFCYVSILWDFYVCARKCRGLLFVL